MVARAGGEETPAAAAALERLCRTYWRPIYAWLRRRGEAPADAEDLTQGFLASFLARQSLPTADPAKGRFRSFLLASLANYVRDQRDNARAQKRGGGQPVLSLDDTRSAEAFYVSQCVSGDDTPDRHFDRQFAEALFARARQSLRDECASRGKLALYEALGPEAGGGVHSGLQSRGEALGLTAQAARSVAHRLRQRYRELIEAEINSITASAGEAEDERRHLIAALA
jgi:DNA-directed RNA polymerase specialized sigma24 family protein